MNIVERGLFASFALVLACGDDASSAEAFMDDDVPSGSCMTDTGECDTDSSPFDGDGGPTTAPNDDECSSSLDCATGLWCTATFDGDIGEFECRAACVGDMDETLWCLDDAACCDAESVCGPRGYCQPPVRVGDESTSTSDTDDTSTSTSDDSGTTSTSTGG